MSVTWRIQGVDSVVVVEGVIVVIEGEVEVPVCIVVGTVEVAEGMSSHSQ